MKNTFKKALFSLWAIGLVWASGVWLVNAQFTPSTPDWIVGVVWVDQTDDGQTEARLITTIKRFINLMLLFLATIAFAILLRWWFQMVSAAWDDGKYKKWFTILKQAAIWLVVIWLSWLIVTAVFWLINRVTTG